MHDEIDWSELVEAFSSLDPMNYRRQQVPAMELRERAEPVVNPLFKPKTEQR